ncbi:MAG: hypothetical protein IPK17_06065 [Chloroflexi bacterium]|uniref:hypothetical protein n=1 Tax=Candidatus Flexifilum breve TaxID=3140694 RepID=UPI003135A805|nr:hypothetical protein [Chloroflexota bacterium]
MLHPVWVGAVGAASTPAGGAASTGGAGGRSFGSGVGSTRGTGAFALAAVRRIISMNVTEAGTFSSSFSGGRLFSQSLNCASSSR